MVIHLAVVVEHHQPLREMAGQHEFDGVVEELNARRDDHRLGLGENWSKLRHGRAGLQRHRYNTELGQRCVHNNVVRAVEAQDCDTVTPPDEVGVPCTG